MKLKDLIEKLNKFDGELDVLCCIDEEDFLPEGHIFRLFEINEISVTEAEKRRGDDQIPTLKFGKSDNSQKHVLINISTDF